MIANALSKCSGSIKRLSRPPQFFLHRQTMHISINLNVRFKDVAPTTTGGSQDILLQNIQLAKDSSDLLDSIHRHHSIMNSNHVLQALKCLFNLQKAHSSRTSNGQVVSSKDFRKLCEVLKFQVRHLEVNELIDVLKCMGYLGVSADSKIMSIILGLISKQVNDISLQQIVFLDFIMKDFKSTPLVKALKIALPIVFEANLQMKCDFEDVSHMSDLLSFVVKKKHMGNSADKLVAALTEKRSQLSFKDARNIVFSLCDSSFCNENYKLLLCYSLDIVTDSLHKMDFYEMESMLSRLSYKHDSNSESSFYHEEFCNGCAQMVISNNYSFEQSIWILKKLIKFNHVNLPLLIYLSEKVESEPWQLEQCGANGLIVFLHGFSAADFKPPNWNLIKPLVIKACQCLQDRSELPWLLVVLDLCILDCWSEEFLKKVFDPKFLTVFMAREYNKLDQFQLLMLDQVSATLSPWAIKPRAPQDMITDIIQKNGSHITSYPLQAAIVHGLGGQEYVHTNVISPLGHFFDHVVVMRKGGYPVAINSSAKEPTERISSNEINLPPDSTMIALLLVPSTMCAINNERVRGLYRIHINSIEALGIAVAPILQPVWNTLPEFERIPYLMRAIQEKLDNKVGATKVITPS